MVPSSLFCGDGEFTFDFFAPRALAAVSWSPLNNTAQRLASKVSTISCVLGIKWYRVYIYQVHTDADETLSQPFH